MIAYFVWYLFWTMVGLAILYLANSKEAEK